MQVDWIQCIQTDIATAPAKSFGEKLMGLRRKRSPARVQPSASAKTLPRAGSWQVSALVFAFVLLLLRHCFSLSLSLSLPPLCPETTFLSPCR